MSIAELVQRGEEFERLPPHDVAAEQCVLGGMLLSKDAISDVIEVIRPADHYRPAHQLVHEAILDLYARGEPADPITVANELSRRGELARVGGAPYLHTLIASVPTAANAGYYARIVRERAILRRLVAAGTRIVQFGYAGDGDADELVDRAQAEVYSVTDRRIAEDYHPLSEIMPGALEEIEAISAHGGGISGVPTGFADLDALTNGLHPGQMIVIAARPAVGKALALDTPLPTPAGWTTMGDVQVGDYLIDANGKPTRVLAATGALLGRPCYEVEFSDGEVILADENHQWLTWTRAARRYDAQLRGGQKSHAAPVPPHVATTAEIARTLRCGTEDQRPNHAVALTKALDLPDADLPLPPYALGAWLGDGATATARSSSADAEIPALVAASGIAVKTERTARAYRLSFPRGETTFPVRSCVSCGAPFIPRTSQVRTCGRSCGGKARFSTPPAPVPACSRCGAPMAGETQGSGPCRACWKGRGTLQEVLRSMGVLGEKHIPGIYLRASIAQRCALLAGLLDAAGTVANRGSIQIALANARLAGNVRELIVSLGYRCTMTTKRVRGRSEESSTCFMINFTAAGEAFRFGRNQQAHPKRLRTDPQRTRWRYIVAVRSIPSRPVRCVQVDNAEHLYLAGRGMIPTHNSALALDFARSATIRHGLPTVVFSLEMGRNEITMRLLSAEARVPMHVMRTGQMSDDDWGRLARRMSEVADAPLFIDDSPNMSLMEIRAKCRRLKQRHDLKLVIIDYLQLMSSSKRVESRQQEVSEFSRSLKLLAKEIEVPVVALSQLNRGPEQRQDKKPMLSDLRESGCMTAGTTLLRADTGAPATFGELLRNGWDGVLLWSFDERHRLVPAPVVNVFESGTKDVYRLRLASGRQVEATANHPFLAFSGWVPLGNLGPGDRIAIPRRVPAPAAAPLGWSEHRIGLLAHLIGAGCVIRRQPVRYTSNDPENLEFVEAAAAAADKRLPSVLYSASDDEICLFLRHLWAADGCVWLPHGKSAAKVYYASSSRELADGVAYLLARIGIVARIRQVEKAGCNPGYHVIVADGPSLRIFCERVGVHGRRGETARELGALLTNRATNTNIDTVPLDVWDLVKSERARAGLTERQFQAAIGMNYCGSALYKTCPSRERLMRCADVLGSGKLREIASSDVFWDKIVSIEPLGPQPVYDATVKETHNFIANGINAHNSIEQDADVVILLHREDAYERESPRAGEADLIVAKHRNGPTATVTVAFQGHYSRFVDMAPG